jgi:nucleoside-diphosphate-sugar epimerase
MADDKRVLVTGATGFIGTRLVQALVAGGACVRALTRRGRPEPPPGLTVDGHAPLDHPLAQLWPGDVTDRESLIRAAEGCSEIYHLAGYAKNWAPRRQTYHDLNVQGVLNVFEAGKQAGVRRIVWTSSQMTSGPTPPGQMATEEMPRASDRYFTDYERTKHEAERLAARAAAEQGVPVVIVNPTRVYGPGYLTEGNSVTQLIDQYDRGRVPILPNLGRNVGNWVFVEDVVRGLMLAMERGRVGEKYFLSGENASLKEFFRTIDRVTGRRHFQVPLFCLSAVVTAHVQQRLADWCGVYPKITPGWVKTFFTDWPCCSAKAERELGYRVTPLDEGIRMTREWLKRVRKRKSEPNGSKGLGSRGFGLRKAPNPQPSALSPKL